jgi:predicted DNA-binding transcriptional regulator AlpA
VTLDILGLSEVAELLGTSRGHVGVMRTRGKLPPPDAMLHCGPIWLRTTIEEWMKE